jgi:arylsulfatase A-like enzyme
VAFAENNGMYYDYDLSVDGAVVPNGDAPGDYSTRVVGREAARFIRGTDGPLFVYFAPAAPHGPATPAPGQWGMYRWLDRWRPPGYDEADVSDKPGWVRAHPPLDAAHRRRLDRARRRRLATLHPVDIAVRGIVRALRDTGRLHNTMIVFMSDNGFLLGEHRLHGKQAPYDESIRVPMVVRYDPLIDAARTDDRLVANIDLAPTWAQIAGVSQPGADGRSFVPLLSAENRPWRTAFLVEHLRDRTARMPTYCSVRSVRYDFTVYATGEEELYDLATDPYQLENRAGDPLMDLVRRDMLDRMRRLCRPYPPDGRFELPPF